MLNLRYHVVSLIAVFLALGVGVIVGSTVVDRVTVDQLKTRLDSVEKSVSQTRKDNNKLTNQVHTWEQFADQGRAELFTGQLRGVPVMVVGVDGIDRKSVDDLRTDLADAGANVQGTLWLTDKLNLRSQGETDTLAAALAIPENNPDIVRAAAFSKLASALQGSGDPTGVIPAMQQGGFITYQAPPPPTSTSTPTPTTAAPGPGAIPLPGTRSVIVSGAGARLDDDTMTMPFVTQLALNGAPVVAAEAGQDTPGGRGVFVGLIRNRPETATHISTVDNLESFIGQAATVFAIRDAGKQTPAHYGVGPGAQRLLPETPAAP